MKQAITIDDYMKRFPHLDKQVLIAELRRRGIEVSEDNTKVFLVSAQPKH